MYLKENLKYYKYLAIPTLVTIVVIFFIYSRNTNQINTPETKVVNGIVYENINMSVRTNLSDTNKIRNKEVQTRVKILNNNNIITVLSAREATTEKEQSIGLMYVKTLGIYQSELFISPQPMIQSFWMAHTLIPLDILYINSNMNILQIVKATPCITQYCRTYFSNTNAKYVLEVNPLVISRYNISTQDRIQI
jgi:hypothetical protein